MTRRVLASVAAAAATLLLAGGVQAANLVTDGNFDSPSGGGSFTTLNAGSSFGPWQVDTGSVDLIGGYWQAPVGGGSVDLDGNSPGSISQTLNLAAGKYDLTFYLSGNPDGLPLAKLLNVDVGGTTGSYSYVIGSNTHASMNYLFETLPFTVASAGPVTLTFASGDSGTPYGPVVGGVSIGSAVPEPAAWALMLIGLAGVGSTLRRRNAAHA